MIALLILSAALLVTVPAQAHHRQAPEVLPFNASGDTPLPRTAPPGNKTFTLAVEAPGGREIVAISPWKSLSGPVAPVTIAAAGSHANPAVSATGRAVAFDSDSDPLGLSLPGRQVVNAFKTTLLPVTEDPSGTSVNPSVDATGNRVAFESLGDLAGTGSAGVRHVFLREGGLIRQLSQGVGTSRNPVLTAKQRLVIFESTSDPGNGADTGVSQIWVGPIDGTPAPITAGAGSSRNPGASNDGRLVVFESTAALAAGGADTGVPQIFAYDVKSRTYARLTAEPQGCTLPAAFKVQRDWRIAYVCSGLPYFTMLRADQRYLVPATDGVTQRVVPALGVHFLLLSTTADLMTGSGTTPGRQVYLVNLFKRPAVPVAGTVTWFPTQGIPPL